MLHTYQDRLNGFFSIATADEWLPINKDKASDHYIVLLNFGEPIVITKDFVSAKIDTRGICLLAPGSYISNMEYQDQNHCLIEFNQAFYCLELHDKELSCNGLFFGALSKLPILITTPEESFNNIHLVEIFKGEMNQQESTQGEMLKLLLKRLIIKCVRLGKQQLFIEENPLVEETDVIRKFQALVEKHFREKHKVTDYAELMFKSPKTLSNTFKKLQNQSPLQIIQERIVLEAKRQLYYTDKSVKEITFELGFSEPAQFSRLFKNITDVSPSEFQKNILI